MSVGPIKVCPFFVTWVTRPDALMATVRRPFDTVNPPPLGVSVTGIPTGVGQDGSTGVPESEARTEESPLENAVPESPEPLVDASALDPLDPPDPGLPLDPADPPAPSPPPPLEPPFDPDPEELRVTDPSGEAPLETDPGLAESLPQDAQSHKHATAARRRLRP